MPTGIAAIVFFGLGAVLFTLMAIRPSRLTLTDQGIDCRSLRSWHMDWDEIAGLRLLAINGSTTVILEYPEGVTKPHLFGRLRGRTVPWLMSRQPEEVLALIEHRLAAVRADRPDLPVRASVQSLEEVAAPRWAIPWVGIGLIVALSLVYIAEVRFPVTPGDAGGAPSLQTLAAWGGSSWALIVGEGQWSRIVTASLLHGSIAHLLGNCLALFWAGCILEGVAGRAWFAAIYALGGLAGTLVSILFNAADTIGVGASGAIMALFAATFVLGFHYRSSKGQARLQGRATGMLFPALFSAGGSVGSLKIDVAAHAGGAAAGALVGLFLLRGWTAKARHPARTRLAIAVVGAGCVLVAAALWPTRDDYDRIAELASVSKAMAAGTLDAAGREIGDYVIRYPGDAAGWRVKGDVDFARADPLAARAAYRMADGLDPTMGGAAVRGLAAFYAGDREDAVTDLQRAVAADPSDLYPALWLDIVRERQGLAPSLDAATGSTAGKWPKSVERLLLGSISPETLKSIAARSPKRADIDEGCEADFYIAEWDLIHGRRDRATGGFRQAVSGCPPSFVETWMARSELARATASP